MRDDNNLINAKYDRIKFNNKRNRPNNVFYKKLYNIINV